MGSVFLTVGVVAMILGSFIAFGGMMSDAPDLADRYTKHGCTIVAGGLIALIVGATLLIIRLHH